MNAMSSSDRAPEQICPSCGRVVSTAGLEPFAKITCPGCGFQLRVERVFENYQIVEPLGSGGMGSVFKARDLRLQRFVALKLLRREFADDASFVAKLQEEARITASIHHPHVVEVYAVGEDHGQFYLVMELVDGGSLDDKMEDEKRIPETRALEIGVQVAQGLQAALAAGLIHRDIKPANILFADAQTAKIVDFGLAQLAEEHAEAEGEIWGTPYYLAPERLTNSREDCRSDLYSLGATLFHAIAGKPPFAEETLSAAALKKLKATPTPLREAAPDVSAKTAAVIDRMLRPDPADRPATYAELIKELHAAQAALATPAEGGKRWPRRILFSLGVVVVIAILAFLLTTTRSPLMKTNIKAIAPATPLAMTPPARTTATPAPPTKALAPSTSATASASPVRDEKNLLAAESPGWQATLAAERKAEASYQFPEAVAILEKAKVTASALQQERADDLQRARWLADWKNQLIADINGTGFGGAVTDIHGVRYDGPVRRANANELELRTRYGRVMVRWLNLSPAMLLAMSRAFIQAGFSGTADREWRSAIFAEATAQTEAANQLAAKAAAADPKFHELLPRFFPDAR